MLQEISNSYLEFNDNVFSGFFDICQTNLGQHAHRKKKYARGNHMPFIKKTQSKDRTEENRNRYVSQTIAFRFQRKLKKNILAIYEKNVCDNKIFWKTVKSFLLDKIVSKDQITLV